MQGCLKIKCIKAFPNVCLNDLLENIFNFYSKISLHPYYLRSQNFILYLLIFQLHCMLISFFYPKLMHLFGFIFKLRVTWVQLCQKFVTNNISMNPVYYITVENGLWCLTWITACLADNAIISAHETVIGQTLSSFSLISSTISNPLREFLFGIANFSETPSSQSEFKSTDPSQPYINNISRRIMNHELSFQYETKMDVYSWFFTTIVSIGKTKYP